MAANGGLVMELPYAEDMNYWKTSKSTPDSWIEKAIKLVNDFGGKVIAYAFGYDHHAGRQAYMFAFTIDPDNFKIVYPVLPTYSENELAAKRQAATLLYHHIKSRLLDSKIMGARTAFFSHFVLPDGRTPIELTEKELMTGIPLFHNISQKLIER